MRQLHAELQRMGCGGADQSPVLSSSHFLNVQHPLYIVPPSFSTGRKRALLIGINYQGQEGELVRLFVVG